jgi:hypothetical protein
MTSKFRLTLAGLIVAFMAVLSLGLFARPVAAAGVDTTRDCDETAIIHCGVMTLSELKTKYAQNEAGDLPAVYKAFGVTNFDGLVDGVVWRDGTVTVGGKTVATGAMTAARNMNGGAIAGSNAKVISPSVWPAQFISGKPAYVKMVNGQFAYAVLKTCGNPVKAKPVTPPPAPAAVCTRLEAIKKSRNSYEFKATASASNGATISNYAFTVTHSTGTAKIVNVPTNQTSASSGTLQLEDGTHTAKVVVKTSVGDKTSAACTVKVTVTPEDMVQVCNPANGQIITVKKSEASKYKPVGDAACKPVQVCEVATGKIVTVKASEATSNKYKPVGDEACKPKEDEVRVCNPDTKEIINVKKSEADKFKPEGDEACKPKVEGVATEIPSTGPTDLLASGLGVSSLTAAGYYWRQSRRQLMNKLMGR